MRSPEAAAERDGFVEERSELSAVLESPLFARAPSLRVFLSYICEQYFEGRADELKEYSIAVEALGRNPGFDHTQDSIVRVEAHKLRKRLKRFYETEGSDHRIRIEIPPGQYAPSFVNRRNGGLALSPARSRVVVAARPGEPTEAIVLSGLETAPLALKANPPRRIPLYGTAALLTVGLMVLAAVRVVDRLASNVDTATSGPALIGPEVIYRISCGSPVTPYVDEIGMAWGDDRFFQGGAAVETPSATVSDTWSPAIFRYHREGPSFSYNIPLQAGLYELHLYFAETVYGPDNPGTGESSRIFDVAANGRPILSSFDILSDSGRPNAATTKLFTGLSPDADGLLRLDFKALSSNALINGIEVIKSSSSKPLPIRILAGDRKSPLIDKSGQDWGPDRYFTGGRSVPRMNSILNTPDPSLYSAERYGNFRYVIPVAAGTYTVRLHFVETWWGEKNPGGGGQKSRVFSVHCNGVTLLDSFDVFREAGGENRALVKTFSGITPNPQSRIELSFIPTANYALVNAIEVFPK